MSLPAWFCPVVCAGLDLNELLPSKPYNNQINFATAKKYRFKSLAKITHKARAHAKAKAPAANSVSVNNFEENEMINVERDIKPDPVEDPYGYDLDGPSPCVGQLPDAKTCLQQGKEISNWFMQRALNPGNLCN